MNVLSKKGIALALVAALSSLWLVGCGVTPQQLGSSSTSTESRAAAVTKTGSQLASDFAQQLEAAGAKPTVKGAVVTVKDQDGKAVTYDFTNTPKTQKVVFTANGVTSTIDTPTDARIAVRLILIGVKMVYGGAKAWYWYTHTHTGADYNREELVKAIVYGIISEGVGGLPGGFLWKRLLPLVWKWVTGEAPIKPTLKDLFELMKKDVNDIASILAEGEALQRAGAI